MLIWQALVLLLNTGVFTKPKITPENFMYLYALKNAKTELGDDISGDKIKILLLKFKICLLKKVC